MSCRNANLPRTLAARKKGCVSLVGRVIIRDDAGGEQVDPRVVDRSAERPDVRASVRRRRLHGAAPDDGSVVLGGLRAQSGLRPAGRRRAPRRRRRRAHRGRRQELADVDHAAGVPPCIRQALLRQRDGGRNFATACRFRSRQRRRPSPRHRAARASKSETASIHASASASLTGSRRAIASATRSRTSSLRASGRFNRISRSASPCRRARSARIRSAGGAGVSRGPSSMRATVTNYADSRQDGERGMGIERAAAPPAGGDRGHRKKLPTSSTASTAAASVRARSGSAAPRRPRCSWSTPPRTRRRCWSRCRSRAAGGTRRRPR